MLKTMILAGLVLAGSNFGCSVAQGQVRLSEEDVVRIGLDRADFANWIDAGRAQAESRVAQSGLWHNPEIEYSLEDVDLAAGSSSEQSFWLRQRFNLAGVPGLERRSASFELAARNVELELDRSEQAALIRRHFYQALGASRRAEAVSVWHERFEQLVREVDDRARAGDASRFDALRLRHELTALGGERREARAEATAARHALFGLIDHEPAHLVGALLPSASDASGGQGGAPSHARLRALDAQIQAAELSARAARRQRWPELTLGLGRRELDEPGLSANGHLVMVGLEIPIFDRALGRRNEEQARVRRLQAERELLLSSLNSEIASLEEQLDASRRSALALAEIAGEASLAEMAEGAYAAGEIGVLELIDAHRTELNAHRDQIRRALAARYAKIELRLLKGE